jgi:uncharacterized protein (TIGR03086 family)
MDAKELFAKSVQCATDCIRQIRTEQFENATPCTEWNLRTLLNHLIYEISWVPDIVSGKTVAEVGSRYDGDLIGTDLLASWNRAADAALVAIKRADLDATAHLSYGDVPVRHYVMEIGGDILIHTWDVGQGAGFTFFMDEPMAETVYQNLLPRKEEMAASGIFAAALDVADDAPIQTKLLALTGRAEPGRAA